MRAGDRHGPRNLSEAGPLTIAEQTEIRVHPTAGAALVAPLRFARHALSYVLFHHECWDGSGYPSGLRGRAIPLEGRLLGVVDAFDAMTSARPYRPALSTDRALAEIAICAGSQFDPRIAEAFLDAWAEHAGAWRATVG